ncbi:hypothetical protein, partial [Corallococcus terminator]
MKLKPLSRAVLTAALATGLSATPALAVTPVTPIHESPPVASTVAGEGLGATAFSAAGFSEPGFRGARAGAWACATAVSSR